MPRIALLTFALAFATLAEAGAAPPTSGKQGPLALHTPGLVVPVEALVLDIAPEVQVKLSIDPRGVVTAVDVLSITPSGEFDSAFRSEVVDTLKSWRFAPATENGKAVASTLAWRVRFPAAGDSPADTVRVTAPIAGADAAKRRAAVLALPLQQRLRLLATQAATAKRLLDPKRAREVSSPRFVVRSDAEEAGLAKAVATNLEVIFNVLETDLLSAIRPQPETHKIQVFVYRTRAQYESLLAGLWPIENSAGFYSPAGMIALHLEQPTSETVNTILFHEATHAFLDRHIIRAGVALPRWLDEGFAEYVGNSAVERGRLKPGKTIARQRVFVQGRLLALDTFAGLRLDEAKDALRRGKGLQVQEMLDASPDIFYGERSSLFYASAWLLTHFLRDGGADWSSARFPQFLLYLAEGYPQDATFTALYGDSAAAQLAFQQYVKGF